jgi:hypothetical protein
MNTDNNGIYKPTKLTYFICKDENGVIQLYDKVEKGLVMTSKYTDITEFSEKEDWINALLDSGIKLKGKL